MKGRTKSKSQINASESQNNGSSPAGGGWNTSALNPVKPRPAKNARSRKGKGKGEGRRQRQRMRQVPIFSKCSTYSMGPPAEQTQAQREGQWRQGRRQRKRQGRKLGPCQQARRSRLAVVKRQCNLQNVCFWQLIFGDMTIGECAMLVSGDIYDVFYLYPVDQVAVLASPDIIPWPVAFVLRRLHRKHTFASRQLPSVARLGAKVKNWANKIKLVWHFSREADGSGPLLRRHCLRRVPQYNQRHIPPELSAFINSIKIGIFSRCQRALSRFSGRMQCTSNLTEADRIGMQRIREGPCPCASSDMDGCFVVARRDEWTAAIERIITYWTRLVAH